MEVPKIQLSPTELQLASDAEIILTKNSIMQKTISLFEMLGEEMRIAAANAHWAGVPPKVSRGEQYRGLPYVVLDYPRIASGNDLLFIRTMFWWGHHFSSTLQLAGSYREQYGAVLQKQFTALSQRDFYVGGSPDPWQHHFGKDNYAPVAALDAEGFCQHLQTGEHTKIAARFPLQQWDGAAIHLWESWCFLKDLVT